MTDGDQRQCSIRRRTTQTLRRRLTHLPVSSSNTRMPRDQKSTLKLCPLLRMISGATYSGVPQKVQVLWPHLIFLAKPKSTWAARECDTDLDGETPTTTSCSPV